MVVSKVVPMQEDFRFKLSIKSLGAKEFGSFAVTSDRPVSADDGLRLLETAEI